MWRALVGLAIVALVLIPATVQAETVFMPQMHNGPRNWFTVADVLNWSAAANNVMPITCTATQPGIFTSCTVQQAQPLTLVWDVVQGKVVAK